MTAKSFLSKFYLWLSSPEVFGSVTKKIPGKWHLYEYYMDSENDLLHVKESDLKSMNESLFIAFSEDRKFELSARLPVPFLGAINEGSWDVQRNFITLIDANEFRNNIEFQFAFEKGNLKLLKKDKAGKIEFFGFLKPEKQNTK